MYDAKEAGRDRVAVYAPRRRGAASRMRARLIVARADPRARSTDGRASCCTRSRSSAICGDATSPRFELLLRMRGDDGELVPPGDVPARRRALRPDPGDRPLGLRAGGRAARREHARRPRRRRSSVNLSGAHDERPGPRRRHRESSCAATPIPRGRLIVEITETAAIVNIERARALAHAAARARLPLRARRLRRRLRVVLLPQAPPVRLPEDRRRVRPRICGEPDRPARRRGRRRRSRAASASRRSPSSSATTATLELLRELGVDYGQGYHLGRPQPVAAILPGAGAVP